MTPSTGVSLGRMVSFVAVTCLDIEHFVAVQMSKGPGIIMIITSTGPGIIIY